MQTINQHEKAIRYLGIAVVVISALAILGTIIGFIFMAVGQAAWNAYGPDLIQQGLEYDYGRGHHGSGYYGDLSSSDVMGLMGLTMGIGYVALGWELVTAVVSLIAGILAIRGAADRSKLGGVFGWGIGGAVAAFLGGRLVTCVLLVIAAVFANKDKNAPAWPEAGYGYAAPAPGYGQPVPPAAPAWGQPAAPAYGAVPPAPTAATPAAAPLDPQVQACQAAYQQGYGAPAATAAQPVAYAAAPVASAGAAQAAAPADGAAQAAAAVNAAEAGEAARAAAEYQAGAVSAEAADVAHLAADAAEAQAGTVEVVVIEDAPAEAPEGEQPKA
ncbi:hypothetical protein [Adlercreutzia faecimuris]|uniref:DUF4064 domain-containing protein n=1 Tax=Adlercreutzia faecimuris TaxID=2897341 RepID=A0ABS9WG08_9ACTN|nr:hypothetical protein [Adlercreutzia sp. JBNU-10]MCI2241252.1 hypothetical protein [Adlercreutzia sp. JBNU-10]